MLSYTVDDKSTIATTGASAATGAAKSSGTGDVATVTGASKSSGTVAAASTSPDAAASSPKASGDSGAGKMVVEGSWGLAVLGAVAMVMVV